MSHQYFNGQPEIVTFKSSAGCNTGLNRMEMKFLTENDDKES
jgi:hypothetical protein